MLIRLKVHLEDITINFQYVKRVFELKAPSILRKVLKEFMDAALIQLDSEATELPSYLSVDFPVSKPATRYLDSLLRGDGKAANELIHDAVNKGTDIRDIYLQILENVQLELGRL